MYQAAYAVLRAPLQSRATAAIAAANFPTIADRAGRADDCAFCLDAPEFLPAGAITKARDGATPVPELIVR